MNRSPEKIHSATDVTYAEIVEHDALDPITNPDEDETPKKPDAVVQKPVATAKPLVESAKVGKAELPGSWTLKPLNDKGTAEQWMEEFEAGCDALLELTAKEEDVLDIYTVNRPLFDRARELDKGFFDNLMAKFTNKRKFFKEEK